MPDIDPEIISQHIREVAQARIIPRFQQLQDHEINTKSGPADLVTIADVEAERDLTRIFKDLLPGSQVVGEEAVSEGTIDAKILGTSQDDIWVVDPVDGTNNFAHGKPIFGTMVALVRKGEVVRAWIYNILGERMAVGEKGSGVFINGEQKTLVPPTEPLHDMRAFISRKFMPDAMRPDVETNIPQLGNAETYLCCALEYLDILDGKGVFSLYTRINPWDHLPGAFLMKTAGGHIRKWNGSDYTVADDSGGLLNAPDEKTWDNVYDIFLKKFVEKIKTTN